MPKYRSLSQEELSSLEKEFVDFLVLNGITADDWLTIKKDQSKASRMIDLFSDVVFEKILRNIQYLEHYSPTSIKTFHCAEDEIFLIGVDSSDASIDFTTSAGIKRLQTNPPEDLRTYRTSKKYNTSREMEIFTLLQNGCVKSDGYHYRLLNEHL